MDHRSKSLPLGIIGCVLSIVFGVLLLWPTAVHFLESRWRIFDFLRGPGREALLVLNVLLGLLSIALLVEGLAYSRKLRR